MVKALNFRVAGHFGLGRYLMSPALTRMFQNVHKLVLCK